LVKLDERLNVEINLIKGFNADIIIEELLDSFSINRGILSLIIIKHNDFPSSSSYFLIEFLLIY
jgi:hypothetical protein